MATAHKCTHAIHSIALWEPRNNFIDIFDLGGFIFVLCVSISVWMWLYVYSVWNEALQWRSACDLRSKFHHHMYVGGLWKRSDCRVCGSIRRRRSYRANTLDHLFMCPFHHSFFSLFFIIVLHAAANLHLRAKKNMFKLYPIVYFNTTNRIHGIKSVKCMPMKLVYFPMLLGPANFLIFLKFHFHS